MPLANPHRGEVNVTALGQEWTLRFGMNEMCVLEAQFDCGFSELMTRLIENPRMTLLRTVFQVAVVGDISEEDAGTLIDDIGMAEAIQHLIAAVELSMAKPEPGSRPRKRGVVGTGKLTALTG